MLKTLNKKLFLLATLLFLLTFANTTAFAKEGFVYDHNGWYYYQNDTMLKNQFIKDCTDTYYAGDDGRIYLAGIYKIGDYYYGFKPNGKMMFGQSKINDQTFFFGTKTGRMYFKKWIKTGGKYYYYDNKGVMATDCWIGNYYVGNDGSRLTGLQKIGNLYYFFNTVSGKKVTNKTKTIQGVKYAFGGDGSCAAGATAGSSIASEEKASVAVENTYYSDPKVDELTLLASIIYCEAGNQELIGQLAVGMVLMNRVSNASFPFTLKEVIYQKNQFAPTRDGSLLRALKNPSIVHASCYEAAKQVLALYYAAKDFELTVNKQNIDFESYLFFMSQASYNSLGLRSATQKIGDHVFFKSWS